jgi:dihydroorotate dehydrogenase (fumarate)
MADLRTTYMGLKLNNPIIAGASKLTANMNTIRQIEAAGAGALVCASLFEEQIELEEYLIQQTYEEMNDRDPEMSRMFPMEFKHSGAKEYLMWMRETKQQLSIPVIASLNAKTKTRWVEYAQEIAETGVDGLELNFYFTPRDMSTDAFEIESTQREVVQTVTQAVSIPIAVKLSYFYSNPLQVISGMDEAGAQALILFNRLFENDIDIDQEKHINPIHYSNHGDYKLPARFVGLLYGKVEASLCANTGIYSGDDVIRVILAGADAAYVVSTLYQNGIDQIGRMKETLSAWMNKKGYANLSEFRGKLADKNVRDPFIYSRNQYVDLILHSDKLLTHQITDI